MYSPSDVAGTAALANPPIVFDRTDVRYGLVP
jgi:hypothetical protein